MPLDQELLNILVCPLSKKPLVLEGETLVSTDAETRRVYSIKDDIPIMLIEESRTLDETAWREIMNRHGQLVEE
jgi:uncharacterized protein